MTSCQGQRGFRYVSIAPVTAYLRSIIRTVRGYFLFSSPRCQASNKRAHHLLISITVSPLRSQRLQPRLHNDQSHFPFLFSYRPRPFCQATASSLADAGDLRHAEWGRLGQPTSREAGTKLKRADQGKRSRQSVTRWLPFGKGLQMSVSIHLSYLTPLAAYPGCIWSLCRLRTPLFHHVAYAGRDMQLISMNGYITCLSPNGKHACRCPPRFSPGIRV